MTGKSLREVAKRLARNAVERLNKSPASAADIALVQASIVKGMRIALEPANDAMIEEAESVNYPAYAWSVMRMKRLEELE
jgi:hypothetical protein